LINEIRAEPLCHFFYPEWINKEVTDPELKMYVKAIMYDSVRQFPPAKNYNDLLMKLLNS
jgi:hypothetical protein